MALALQISRNLKQPVNLSAASILSNTLPVSDPGRTLPLWEDEGRTPACVECPDLKFQFSIFMNACIRHVIMARDSSWKTTCGLSNVLLEFGSLYTADRSWYLHVFF